MKVELHPQTVAGLLQIPRSEHDRPSNIAEAID
jgi:hypothetical protein